MSGIFGGGGKSTSEERYTGLQLQTSAYGKPIPLGYGTARVPPNLLWYGSFVATPHTEETGGKGGGGGGRHTTYTYRAAVVMGLGEGIAEGIGTVWADKQQTTLAALGFTFFNGASGQATWSFLTTNHPTQAIPYDATAYVASGALQLGNSPSLPNLNFEVQFPLRHNVAGGILDAEPSTILNDYLTHALHGANFPYLQSFAGSNNYRTYCIAMGFFLSPVEQSQRPAVEFIDEICRITNSAPLWSDGVLKIIPYADAPVSGNSQSYTPDLTPLWSFTDDDYIHEDGEDPVIVTVKPNSEIFNVVRVEFLDRAIQYNTNIAEAKDEQDIALRGLRVMPTIKFESIKEMPVARQVAQLILQRQMNIRSEFRFRVRADYCLAEPMDIIEINEGDDIVDQLARIIEVEDDEEDFITILAEELPIGPGGAPRYNWQLAQGYSVNYAASPGNVNAPAIINAPRFLADPANGGYEVWIAVSGSTGNWGGCDVLVSLDNVQYQFAGRISGPARYGTITGSIGAGADPDTTTTIPILLNNTQLDLVSGTQADADEMRTMIWVDGEVMSFQTATLTGPGAYNLGTYLRRGKYGTTRAAHSSGTTFVRLDPAIFKLPYDAGMVGQTVYFKFRSFNIYGFAHQDTAGLPVYSHVLAAGPTTAFRARGSCVVTENVAYKSTSGASAYDSDVYSVATYANGCSLVFQACQANAEILAGLNSDPTTDQNWTSLDYAWNPSSDGNAYIAESGALIGSFGAYTASTVFGIKYDGHAVQYFKDGVLVRQTPLVGAAFFFDSSFHTPGGAIKNFEFVPLTASPSIPFIAAGSCVATATTARKLASGAAAWDSHVYSAQGYRSGAFVSFQTDSLSATSDVILGLNTDPLTDQSYTSIDYSFEVFGAGNWAIYESGSLVTTGAGQTTSTVYAIAYDGKVVRYLINGSLIREIARADATFFMDSSFYWPGTSIRNLTFTPYGTATPVPFLARGNCVVHNTTAQKVGGSHSWDSDIVSINSYTQCHIRFKPSQSNLDLMVGLNADPFTDQSFSSIDFAWYVSGATPPLQIYESGVLIGSFGTYSTSTELAITYDGSNVRYWKDRVLQRTVALSGAVLFADASFFHVGSAINELHYGPGTALEAIGTVGLEPTAATDTFVLVEPADGSQAYSATTQPAVEPSGIGGLASYTSPVSRSTEVKVSWAAQARISNTTSGTATGTSIIRVAVTINGSLVWDSIMTIEGYSGANDWATFSGTRDFTVPAGQQIQVFLNTSRNFVTGGASPAQTHFWQNALLNLKAAKA